MNENFAKLNYLNSSSIEEVKHFSTLTATVSNLSKDELTQFPYFTMGEIKHAEFWPYEQFDYSLNHLGFRNADIPNEVDLAIFGCSFSFGTGLPIEMLWHTLLANKLNTTASNYGMPGASIESVFNVSLIVSNHTKINKAIFLLPAYSRMQVAKTSPYKDEVNYLSIIPNHDSELCKAYGVETDMLVKATPDEEMYKTLRDNLYFVEYVFKQRNIKTYYSSWDPDTYLFIKQMNLQGVLLPDWTSNGMEQATTDLARDRLHPGPEHHRQFVNKIIEYIK
jgi:hypothetical protein